MFKCSISKLVAICIVMAVFLPLPLYADNDALQDLINLLRDKGSISKEEHQLITNGIKADQEKKSHEISEIKSTITEQLKDIPKVTMAGKFKFESQDKQHSFQPIGRIMWDNIWEANDGLSQIKGGSELRRARLGFQATFYENWKAKLEYDFADSTAGLKDGWVSFNNKTPWGDKYYVKVGQQHTPFGFNTISSSKYMSFVRRPLFADGPLSPSRNYGASIRFDDKRWFVHAGYFLQAPDDDETNVDGDGEKKKTMAIRVAGTPVYYSKNELVHIGASFMHTLQQGDRFRVRQRANSHLDDRIFNTGDLDVDSVDAFDFEVLGIYGPYHVLSEYVLWDLDLTDAGKNANQADSLSGWAVEAGWFVTGESMKYKAGQFSGVSPKKTFLKDGGFGAWQLAVRYENLDLNDNTTIGGEGNVLSAGVNWIPVKNIRFMLTYNALSGFERLGNEADDREPSSVTMRTQVYW